MAQDKDEKGGLKPGRCFLCLNACDEEAYCHTECALAYSDATNRAEVIEFVQEKYGLPEIVRDSYSDN